MRPKVSIILPSLNVADYIKECLNSVLGQSLREIEVICVDAGSTDGTWEILKKYAKKDQRIILLQSGIKSYGKQVNLGIRTAQAKYVAIVETDDFVEKEMYEYLYELAETNSVDYAKADYDSFVLLKNGERLYTRHKLFDNKELYEVVLKPTSAIRLFEDDSSIWKGIYRRDFLTANHIYFNESAGAAFQDIGFALQTLCYAQKVVYTEHSFYRYRMDRENASSYGPKGLQYAYQEFQRLLAKDFFPKDVSKESWNGIYRKLVYVYLCEFDKILKYYNYLINENSLEVRRGYCKWFCDKLCEAVKKGIITSNDFTDEIWFKFCLISYSLNGYIDYMYVRHQINIEKEQKLIAGLKQREIIIFGCGTYGCDVCKRFNDEGVDVVSFCDNNQLMWGKKIGGIEVRSLAECIEKFKNAMFIIANKKYWRDISKQLSDARILKNNMKIYYKASFLDIEVGRSIEY